MKKILSVVLSVFTLFGIVFASGCTKKAENVELEYYDYYEKSESYDKNVAYRNDLVTMGADPSVIYVTEGEEAGYYYMYLTSDDIGASGFQCFRSKDLNDWECMGVAYNPTAYYDEEDGKSYVSFATAKYWAPETIYDPELKLYFLFYNATYIGTEWKFYLDCAVSENPQGPFVQYAQYKGEDPVYNSKLDLYIYEPMLDFANINPEDPLYEKNSDGYMKVIDASPFIDPKTGDKYLYFVHDLGSFDGYVGSNTSSIYVLAVNDDWTPVLDENGYYKTVKKLTEAQCLTVGGPTVSSLNEGKVNEGPFVLYNPDNEKYYLMFSVNTYTQKTYQVRVAVSDSPIGPFTKLTRDEGGFLLYAGSNWSWASGTGHHSVVTANGKTFVVYHAHTNRVNGNSARAIAFDELLWTTNNDGLIIPYVNGPSYSLMPQTAGEYSNIAPEAKVTSTNVAENSDVSYINDGIVKFHDDGIAKEFEMADGSAKITLTFDTYREVTALFIYNSSDYDKTIGAISSVELKFKDEEKKVEGTAVTGQLLFDWDRYFTYEGLLIPGGSFAIQFEPLMVKEITINIPNIEGIHAISDIMVLGK